MDLYNYTVVGSGPAGVSAARRLEGAGTCLLDVGEQPEETFPFSSLTSALSSGTPEAVLGHNWEMLGNLRDPLQFHPKLRASALRHVAAGESFDVLDADGSVLVRGHGSYARGGLSNAWGGQLIRYTDSDLLEAGGWPFCADTLEKYYVDLEEHIGISGKADDMYEFLGPVKTLLPPIPLTNVAKHLLGRYLNRSHNMHGLPLTLGMPRLAVLTTEHRGYVPCRFSQVDFFSPDQPGIYTARRTLSELLQSRRITFLDRHELIGFLEQPDFVDLTVMSRETGHIHHIYTRHLLLGAGTIHSSRLVLMNKQGLGRSLPFIDHPATLIPLFLPALFGSPLASSSYPIQLTGMLRVGNARDMIALYYPGALLRSDLLLDVPLPMGQSLSILNSVLGGLIVAQIWEVSRPSVKNLFSVDEVGHITVRYTRRKRYMNIGMLLSCLRRLGTYSVAGLASLSPPGWGFHYVGTLPMSKRPEPFQTHADGRLWDSKRIRIIDGSNLPSLPAKNHSLTLMANSARIADDALKCGY